jgi:hypothetical protein
MKKLEILLIFLFTAILLKATPPDLTVKPYINPPHRIIRTCCAFGSDLKLWIIPGIKLTEITCIQNMGPHKYLGSSKEGNGILYTARGGFIDLGHLRDQADWTAYLYAQIRLSQKEGAIDLQLGREGGLKTLKLNVPHDLDQSDAMLLAGRIAYDLSIWHEIATWFGSSSVPFVPERYSSFSIEDPYSNLLGVTLGMKAIKNSLPYEEAMTLLLRQTLDSIGVVSSIDDTFNAMEAVRNIWWTRDKALPSKKILIERQLSVYCPQLPWLVPDWNNLNSKPYELEVPKFTRDGRSLNNFYQLGFRLNGKFNTKEIFQTKKKNITQNDFEILLSCIEKQLDDSGFLYR